MAIIAKPLPLTPLLVYIHVTGNELRKQQCDFPGLRGLTSRGTHTAGQPVSVRRGRCATHCSPVRDYKDSRVGKSLSSRKVAAAGAN